MKTKVFIDGSEGTTGLRIADRLAVIEDIELISIPPEYRKDEAARKDCISRSDFVFLCLPDEAARRSAELAEGSNARIIDASTAHRTQWTYGFPEIGFREEIKGSARVAVPGCHASGVLAIVKPLIDSGLLKKSECLSFFSLTGYSGGGKKMIAEYQAEDKASALYTPRVYGLNQQHKHLKEISYISGLVNAPHFSPVVDDFYSGMLVSCGFFSKQLNITKAELTELYKSYYSSGLVSVISEQELSPFAAAGLMSGKDNMKIAVCGNNERLTLYALYDNLGKGASGAAIQCYNLMSGKKESSSLIIG